MFCCHGEAGREEREGGMGEEREGGEVEEGGKGEAMRSKTLVGRWTVRHLGLRGFMLAW